MRFELERVDPGSQARCGWLYTPHGPVRTPVFMPVGTLGGVKGVLHDSLRRHTGSRLVLGNAYHLFLRPGLGVLRSAGGLHGFSTWEGPMLTDSGGFQVFSLSARRRLDALGARFRSHVDGTPRIFTPERVVNIQRVLGSDIIMPLDECPPGDAPHAYASKALDLTLDWLARSVAQLRRTQGLYGYEQALFPIVQGAAHLDLRARAAEAAVRYDMPGYAIGGLAVGEPPEVMYQVLEHLHPLLPRDRPRYLMGVGTPSNLLEAIARGVDMFDCVLPTRNGRNGMIFTWEGVINLRNLRWRGDHRPLEAGAPSPISRTYTRAYLRHLFTANELLAGQIASLHNLAFYHDLMDQARAHIISGDFATWKENTSSRLSRRA